MPLMPQAAFEEVTQLPFEQQPAHDPPPQLQNPSVHVCPLEHEPHALPAAPHVAFDWDASGTHLLVLSQHPPAHEDGVQLHTPVALHACPAVHEPQTAPRVPHLPLLWPVYRTQVVPSQQPSAHVTALHAGVPVSGPPSTGGVMSGKASAET
jgi:hypothetical protein